LKEEGGGTPKPDREIFFIKKEVKRGKRARSSGKSTALMRAEEKRGVGKKKKS